MESLVKRPSWDEIWMTMAHVLARRSIDLRTQVGVLIVSIDNTQVLAVGYNGNARGQANVVDSTEPGMSGMIHGEENALIKMDFNHSKSKIMYTTVSPCDMCAKKIINGYINEVVYDVEYRNKDGIERLRNAGIKIRQFSISK